MTTATLDERVRDAIASVADPEIPVCTIADLGMIERLEVTDDAVEIELLPTWIGCPAKDVIREDVERAARAAAPDARVEVRFVHAPAWTTDRITDAGREALRSFGIAPHWDSAPSAAATPVVVPLLRKETVRCPFCGSAETALESAYGATPCRTQHFCSSCRNPFEGFKEKADGTSRADRARSPSV